MQLCRDSRDHTGESCLSRDESRRQTLGCSSRTQRLPAAFERTSARVARTLPHANSCVLHDAQPLAFTAMATARRRCVAVSCKWLTATHAQRWNECSRNCRHWSGLPGAIQSIPIEMTTFLRRLPIRRTNPLRARLGRRARRLAMVQPLATHHTDRLARSWPSPVPRLVDIVNGLELES